MATQCLTYGHNVADGLNVAAFINPHQINVDLLGGPKIAKELCQTSLFRSVQPNVYAIHTLHQAAVRKCALPSKAIAALHKASLSKFDYNDLKTFVRTFDVLSHVEMLRTHVRVGTLQEREDRVTFAKLISQCGFIYHTHFKIKEARFYYEDACDLLRDVCEDEVLAFTLNRLGRVHFRLGDPKSALKSYEEALKMYPKSENGEFAPKANLQDVFVLYANVGELHLEGGDVEKASQYLNDAIQKLQSDDVYKAYTYYSLGKLHNNQGKYKGAIDNLGNAIKILKDVYGLDEGGRQKSTGNCYRDTENNFRLEEFAELRRLTYAELASMVILIGRLHRRVGEYKDALKQFKFVHELQNQIYEGKQDAALSNTLNNIGSVYYRISDYKSAEKYYTKALAMKEFVTKSELAITYRNLGRLYVRLSKFKRGREFLQKAYDLISEHDTKSVDYANTCRGLGLLECQLGNYATSLRHYKTAIEIFENTKDATESVYLTETQNNYGCLNVLLGDYETAIEMFDAALKTQKKVYNDHLNNAFLAITLNNFGRLNSHLGNFQCARDNVLEALRILERVHGKDAKNVPLASTHNNLGDLYLAQGNCQKAKKHYDKAYGMLEHVYGKDAKNADVARTLVNLGSLDVHLKHHKQGLARLKSAHKIQLQMYGQETKNFELAKTLNNLGDVYVKLEDFLGAKEHYEQSLAMKEKMYGQGANNVYLVSTLNNLGDVCIRLKNYKEARNFLYKSLKMQAEIRCNTVNGNTNLIRALRGLEELNRRDVETRFQRMLVAIVAAFACGIVLGKRSK